MWVGGGFAGSVRGAVTVSDCSLGPDGVRLRRGGCGPGGWNALSGPGRVDATCQELSVPIVRHIVVAVSSV